MMTAASASTPPPSPPVPLFQLYQGDATTVLKDSVATESVDMVFCSLPYWQLRGSIDILAGEIGLDESYKEYLGKVLAVFNYGVHRVLKRTGTLFIETTRVTYQYSFHTKSRKRETR